MEGDMKKSILLALVFSMTACTHTLPHQISASNAPLMDKGYQILGPASGEACETYFLHLFNVGGTARLQAAIDNALDKSGGDALIEITTDIKFSTGLFSSKTCTMVNGLAIKRN